MKVDPRPLILDADGVFLSERPYWNAALGTALDAHGLAERVAGRWDLLADLAFGPIGLQRVTKRVGCNSNWDLAAVLVRALEDRQWRAVVADLLAAEGREIEALQALKVAGARLLGPEANVVDPLEAFGIRRGSSFFSRTVDRFQKVLHGTADLGWTFDRWQLQEPWEQTSRVFGELREAGFLLRVCTGRHRREIEAPIRTLKLEAYLSFSEITSADEIDRAEKLTGRKALGKPHWFGPACATVGFEAAIGALARREKIAGRGFYVGDAWADFLAVEACRAVGLDLTYVHARSGVTTREQERAIAAGAGTRGVVSSLTELPALLLGVET